MTDKNDISGTTESNEDWDGLNTERDNRWREKTRLEKIAEPMRKVSVHKLPRDIGVGNGLWLRRRVFS